MKRLVFTIVMLLIICALTILNIPKEPTLTTTLGTSSTSKIEKTTTTTTKVKKKKNHTKKKESVSDNHLHSNF